MKCSGSAVRLRSQMLRVRLADTGGALGSDGSGTGDAGTGFRLCPASAVHGGKTRSRTYKQPFDIWVIYMKRNGYFNRAAAAILGAVMISSSLPVFALEDIGEWDGTGSAVIYVSPSGSDDGDGSEARPYRTLEAANNAVGELTSGSFRYSDITVYLGGGIYQSEGTVELTNGGNADTAVAYRAKAGEQPIICGGTALSADKFYKPQPEAVASIKSAEARAAVVAYDLRADGINPSTVKRLYCGGESCTVARYPNIWDSDNPPLNIRGSESVSTSPVSFTMDADEIVSTWSSVDGVKLGGHFQIDWIQTNARLDGYDAETGRITVTIPSGNKEYRDGGRYFFTNVFDEIDVPGEYYIDDAGILYYYPSAELSEREMMITGRLGTVVSVTGDRITLDGLYVYGATKKVIRVKASDCRIENSRIGCSEGDGIEIDGYRNVAYNNEVSAIGKTGIRMLGGDRTLGIPSDSTIDNNYIHDFGEVVTVYEGACKFDGVGFTLTHNEISSSPHYAISGDVRDLDIKYNYIHNVCREGGDCGAVYIAWWNNQNIVYQYNYMKDIYNEYGFAAPAGFYADDGGSGKVCRSNLFYNVGGLSILIGGGKDNIVTDNVILKGPDSLTSSFQYDGRTYYDDWCAYFVTLLNGIPPTRDILWDNIFSEPAFGTEGWAYHYPRTHFYKTTTVQDRNDRFVSYATACSVVRNNVITPSTNKIVRPLDIEKFVVMRENINFDSIEMLGFVDPENGDFTITEDSVIYQAIPGFKAYDFSQFGRYDAGFADID